MKLLSDFDKGSILDFRTRLTEETELVDAPLDLAPRGRYFLMLMRVWTQNVHQKFSRRSLFYVTHSTIHLYFIIVYVDCVIN